MAVLDKVYFDQIAFDMELVDKFAADIGIGTDSLISQLALLIEIDSGIGTDLAAFTFKDLFGIDIGTGTDLAILLAS